MHCLIIVCAITIYSILDRHVMSYRTDEASKQQRKLQAKTITQTLNFHEYCQLSRISQSSEYQK